MTAPSISETYMPDTGYIGHLGQSSYEGRRTAAQIAAEPAAARPRGRERAQAGIRRRRAAAAAAAQREQNEAGSGSEV